jgi:hypothetical protein
MSARRVMRKFAMRNGSPMKSEHGSRRFSRRAAVHDGSGLLLDLMLYFIDASDLSQNRCPLLGPML